MSKAFEHWYDSPEKPHVRRARGRYWLIYLVLRFIKELDKQIREVRRLAALAGSLHDKLEAQKSLKALESTRNRKRRELFDAQDAIDAQRDELIGRIEKQLRQRHTLRPVFVFRWRLT